MNFHSNIFPPRQQMYNQWQHQSWNPGYQPNHNFIQLSPFPTFCNRMPTRGPVQNNIFPRPSFQNQCHIAPSYQQGGKRRFESFNGSPQSSQCNVQHHQERSFQGNGHGNTNNHRHKSKKKKVDKRELAENNNYFCDTCDRGFKTKEKYDEHVSGHQQCTVSGCPYIAAPKLVQLHYQLQHKRGFAKKIWSLESQEDIDKWITERKKKFPTSENIKKKEMEKSEKQERGEILETKEFGKFRKGKSGRFQRNKWNRNKRSHSPELEREESPRKQPHLNDEKENSKISTDKKDLLNETLNTNVPKSERKHDETEGETNHADTSHLSGGLAKIVDCYSSENESEVKGGETTQDNQINESKDSQSTHKENRDQTKTKLPLRNTMKSRQHGINISKKRLTLLERLLAPDIRHERNVILQCVYHIVKNNFFAPKECVRNDLIDELKKVDNSNKNCYSSDISGSSADDVHRKI